MNNTIPLRVIFVTNRFDPSLGGLERQAKLMAAAFRNMSVDVTILTDRFKSDLPAFEEIEGIPVHRVWSLWTIKEPFHRIIKYLLTGSPAAAPEGLVDVNAPIHRHSRQSWRRRLLRLLSYRLPLYTLCMSIFVALIRLRKEYDVVQVFQANLLAFAAALAGRICRKQVIAVDAISQGMDELTEFLFPRMTSSFIINRCAFVATSQHIRKDLLGRGIDASNVHFIPYCVEVHPISEAVKASPTSALFVGNVYGDVRQKGLDVLLKAWRQVVAEVPEGRLTIIGVGDFSLFQALAEDEKISVFVNFAGPQKNIGEWHQRSGIFVLPSRYEGLSNALLEAMSFAKACVVTNISGSDDLIEHGVNGLKVQAENSDELARAIIYLMKNPAKARDFGRNARATVEVRYAPAKIAEQYLSLYRKVQGNKERSQK